MSIRRIMRILPAGVVVGVLSTSVWAAGVFVDVQGHPAQRAIERLAARRVIAGTPDGRFLPDEVVTRLDIVRFLVRLLGISGQGQRLPAFKDLAQIPDDAKPAVAASVGVTTLSAMTVTQKKGAITYTLAANKASYGPDEWIRLTFKIENTGKDEIPIAYATTQLYDFIIRGSAGREIARWSLGKPFAVQDKPLPLVPGKPLVFETQWKQLDQNDQPVAPGRYEISAIHTTKADPTTLTVLLQKGLVVGYPDGTFRPRQPVTRQELAALVVRTAGLGVESEQRANAQIPVSDADAVEAWARGSVAVVVERKMLPLRDGAFQPRQGATRADTAVSLDALMVLLNRYDWVKGTLRSVTGGTPAFIGIEDAQKQVRTYRVGAAVGIWRNDRPAAIGDLRPGDTVQMLLGAEVGDVAYLEATGR